MDHMQQFLHLRESLKIFLLDLPKRIKVALAISADAIILMVCALAVSNLSGSKPPPALLVQWLVPVAVAVVMLTISGSYQMVVRFIGVDFFARAMVAMIATAGFLVLATTYLGYDHIPNNVAALFASSGFICLLILRHAAQRLLNTRQTPSKGTKVMIYGAGQAGMQLAQALQTHPSFSVVGFLDDRESLHGRFILGVRVYSPQKLSQLKSALKFSTVLLAIPSVSRAQQRQLLEQLELLAVKVLVMPDVKDLANGSKKVDEFRQVQVQDLLERDPVAPIPELLDACILGKNVLITGAGGSIGSELARQVVCRGAVRLVLLDVSEFSLYQIDRELRAHQLLNNCQLVSMLGSVLDQNLLRIIMNRENIDTVYHAAAYKHVPLVEDNVTVALQNNIFGTLNTVQAALDARVKNFVLVSTDKAVRPANVMGASKRCCELIVQALAQKHPEVRMSMVRFGNVLASSGSVIPVFLDQIRQGGPVTVTHPEVTRYFMTIPEAAQLVIQAGAMGGMGEVFVLDMGQSVKIKQLAERMIHLSGLQVRDSERPNGDIAIHYTGLRPGEKLYEELLIGEQPEATLHARIFKAHEALLEWPVIKHWLGRLQEVLDVNNTYRARQLLAEVVTGFQVPQLSGSDGNSPVINPLGAVTAASVRTLH